MCARTLRRLALTGIVASGIAFVTPVYAAADSWITTKVKLDLLTSDNVTGTAINVDTNDGIVTLHGKVKTEMEKQKAESVARSIEGVISVTNVLQVVPASQEKAVNHTDDQIKSIVKRNMKQEKDLGDIHIASVNNGVVLLSGEADTLDQELRAVHAAAKTPGVKRVSSEITNKESTTQHASNDDDEYSGSATSVDGEPKESPARKAGHKITGWTNKVAGNSGDASTTSSIKLRLMGDSRVPAHDVNVDTTRGVVTLFGIVPTHESKQAAEQDARKVSGVKQVKNELQVVAKSERKVVAAKDDDIEKSVEGAFKNMKDFEKIDVDAKNGVVRLKGKVATLDDKVRAATIARSQTGVRAVEDDLKVGR